MSKFLKTLIVGAASGAATAYFLTTQKGKEVKVKAENFYKAYKANPEEYQQVAKEKVAEYKDLATTTFNDYKGKYESGELTLDSVLETVKTKGQEVADLASQKVGQVKDDFQKEETEIKDVTDSHIDDIVINYQEESEEN